MAWNSALNVRSLNVSYRFRICSRDTLAISRVVLESSSVWNIKTHTCCHQMLDSGLGPFNQITSFAASHIKYVLTRSDVTMDQDTLDPVVEASKSDDARFFALHDSHIRSIVVMLCYGGRVGIVLIACCLVAVVSYIVAGVVVVTSLHNVAGKEKGVKEKEEDSFFFHIVFWDCSNNPEEGESMTMDPAGWCIKQTR